LKIAQNDSALSDAIATLEQEKAARTRANMTNNHDHVTALDEVVVGLFSTAALLGFYGLITYSGQGSWRYFLAGGVCAATSHAISTPIDVVKTRKQVDPELMDASIAKATMKIIRSEGMRSLLAGLGPTAVGYLMEGALKFGIYEVSKPAFRRMLTSLAAVTRVAALDSQLLGLVLCGSISGVAASSMLCPMEAVRIRVVAEPEFAPRGWIQASYRMLKYEGVSALWKGMLPMIYKQVPYTIAKNVSFDLFTTLGYSILLRRGGIITTSAKTAIPLASAFLASILSCISSQPGDMLLSLINAHEGTKTTNEFAKDILKSKSGIRGFFVGIEARFLHVFSVVTIQLLLYDFAKRFCGIAATGTM